MDYYDNIVTIVARLEKVKDHFSFVKAAALVNEKHSSTVFLIVGDGSLRKELEEFVQKTGMNQHVLFLGQRDDIEEILSITDVAVLTSQSEGISNFIIESLASQVPVVATECGGTREIVDNGETGFIIPPRDVKLISEKIVKLLGNKSLAISMGEKGRKLVKKKFDLKEMLEKTEKIYCEFFN